MLSIFIFTFLCVGVLARDVHQLCKENCGEFACCEVSAGSYKCCGYVNGICCAGGKTCCPQGSICMSDGKYCEYPNGFGTAIALFDYNKTIAAEAAASEVPTENRVICPDKASDCPENSTCCPSSTGQWSCCGHPDATCCGDGLHCCPRGTMCNVLDGSCIPIQDDVMGLSSWHTFGSSRFVAEHADPTASRMSYEGVKCDATLECPSQTTCCRNTTGEFACCPMPGAVCCSDGIHCCPSGTVCDLKAQQCVNSDHHQSVISSPQLNLSADHHLCPDGQSVCADQQTCCRLTDGSWGCCPMPKAVCCSDGTHCCPEGYKCDLTSESCIQNVQSTIVAAEVTCPNEEYRCTNNSTCCPLPNEEWACCPFKNGVCCPDMAHCCPANTTCDVQHNKCVQSDSFKFDSANIVPQTKPSSDLCPSGLVSCPGGTCCKNIFGMDACCPHPEAVCCNNGHCCPKGTYCDDSASGCTPLNTEQFSIPWSNKLPAQRIPSQPESPRPTIQVCPDKRSFCQNNQTCCIMHFGSYGCCPFPNATCCADRQHCCPNGTICGSGGFCLRSPSLGKLKSTVQAEQMVPLTRQPIHGSHLPEADVASGETVHATYCGGCEHDWLCCPDSDGLPNRMCCPAPGSICCADGKHCCPSGTVCLENGQCAPRDGETYSASILGRPNLWVQHHPSLPSDQSITALRASNATKAVLFLLDDYYHERAHLVTVCPDRERYCSLGEKCCASNLYGYVCVPSESTCCYPDSDTYCPPNTYCTDGKICKLADKTN